MLGVQQLQRKCYRVIQSANLHGYKDGIDGGVKLLWKNHQSISESKLVTKK